MLFEEEDQILSSLKIAIVQIKAVYDEEEGAAEK